MSFLHVLLGLNYSSEKLQKHEVKETYMNNKLYNAI